MHPSITTAPRQAPPANFSQSSEQDRLAAQLLYLLFQGRAPRRLSLMNGPSSERKYSDAPKGHQLVAEDVQDHLDGRRTWAAALVSSDGLAVAGCRDYDGADGESLALLALAGASSAGVTAAAILLDGRAHVWTFYRRPVPAADIRAQLANLLPAGEGELYPSGNCIRLPLGMHRRKGTRGVLVTQDGRRFDLDSPEERIHALQSLLSLRRNAAPPAAPLDLRQHQGGSAPSDPALWQQLPDGAALMATARYRSIFTRRPQLAQLASGQRPVLQTEAGPRDTGSELVAVLVSNLLTTGRPGAPGGPLVPGLGAPPLEEIRAVALHWRERLRPGMPLQAYQTDVDRLIAKYTPQGYAPEATRGAAGPQGMQLPDLAPARHRGRPPGSQARALDQLVTILAPGALITREGLGAALGVTPRTITTYLRQLVAAGRLELESTARGYRVARVEINSSVLQSEGGCLGPSAASEGSLACDESTHPPPCPAPAVAPPPAGSDPAAPAAPDAAPTAPPISPAGAIARTDEGTDGAPPACDLAPAGGSRPDTPAPVTSQRAPAVDASHLARLVAGWIDAYGYSWRAVRAAARVEFGGDLGGDLGAELRRAFDLAPWRALRAELRTLSDAALLARARTAARAHQRAAKAQSPQLPWYATRLQMTEEERLRRGVELVEQPGRRPGPLGFEERRAGAAARVERLTQQAGRLPREGQRTEQADLWAAVDAAREVVPVMGRPQVGALPAAVAQPAPIEPGESAAEFMAAVDLAVAEGLSAGESSLQRYLRERQGAAVATTA